MASASKLVDVFTKQQRIAELARQSPEMGFTSLAYFIDIIWMLQAFHRTRKDGAVGVDGQDGEDYAANLLGNLQSLLEPSQVRHVPGTAGASSPISPRQDQRPRRGRWEFRSVVHTAPLCNGVGD